MRRIDREGLRRREVARNYREAAAAFLRWAGEYRAGLPPVSAPGNARNCQLAGFHMMLSAASAARRGTEEVRITYRHRG